GDGVARGQRVLSLCAELDDSRLTERLSPLLCYELFWDRSFVAVAEGYAADCRARGEIIGALGGLSYVLGALMRRREITFEHPGFTELEVLGQSGGMWASLPAELMALCRGSLAADGAALGRLAAASLGTAAPALPLSRMVAEVHLRLLGTRAWQRLAATEFVGDPRRWDVSNLVDLALFDAATATAAGDRSAAAGHLDTVAEPLLDAAPSVLTVARLPVAALVLEALGDRDRAAQWLALNRAAVGNDLCLLPAVHLGPAESWLAMIADVAGDGDAALLHEQAARRLAALDARVLELA
ncbi:MAG TPA: hypothetical protein PLV68_03685, partial [Ilumatobacteraceae bacterium]|nr:hypothetical protein [Ilumatobacteraceae bacterium]